MADNTTYFVILVGGIGAPSLRLAHDCATRGEAERMLKMVVDKIGNDYYRAAICDSNNNFIIGYQISRTTELREFER